MHPYENWQVVLGPNNKRLYYYGTEKEVIKELYDEFTHNGVFWFLPQWDWNAEDWMQVCENELENANRHSFVKLPYNFLSSLRNHEYPDGECAEIMKLLAFDILGCIW